MSYQAQIPTAVYRAYPDLSTHPVIVQVFVPGAGWKSTRGYRKRVSPSWCRKLRSEGVTAVALEITKDRTADFRITELVRR